MIKCLWSVIIFIIISSAKMLLDIIANYLLVLCMVLLAKPVPLLSRPSFSYVNSTEERILRKFQNSNDQDLIVFPEDENTEDYYEEPVYRIQRQPPCPDHLTFCEDYDHYPYNQVEQVLKQNLAYQNLFGQDEMEPEFGPKSDKGMETFICASKTKLIFPKVAKNKNNKWKVIVNQKKGKFNSPHLKSDFVQGIRVEKCARAENTPCSFIDTTLGITTRCVQKYTYRRLIALSEDGKLYSDTFSLPSACCCAYTQSYDFFGSTPT